MVSGSPSLLGPHPPRLPLSIAQLPHCSRAHRPGLLPNLGAGALHPRPDEGEGEEPRGPVWWEGLNPQPSREPRLCGRPPQGEGAALTNTRFPGRVRLSGPRKSERGSRGCSDLSGRAAPSMPGSGQGPRLRLERAGAGRVTAQDWVSGAPPSPAPHGGSGHGGPADRVGPDAAPRAEGGRSLSAQAAPSPPRPRTHPPGGGRIPASLQRRGLGGARPASGRQLHAAASEARPAPPLPHTFHRK